ncbi:hypothetical protein O181_063253 [Austropuccinia psidii MF-1]|uniref:Reverse transcriptase domain-containing protein n=1 Tax=Austropuccinia psidii MF-1 TaxID=1389203 RepID=A0A9Q3I0E8_9BASI|nr:hypothetical protein [Austropuccinia psidii MF-1]
MPKHSTPLNGERLSVKGSLTPFLGENPICAKDIPKLEEWPTFSGEGEYNHIELITTIDMFQEDFHIPDEIIVGKLHYLFTRTAKKWYYKMRLDHEKDYLQAILPGWKSHLLPIEVVQFSSASNNIYPLGILDTNLVFPHPAGSVGLKTEIVVMDNFTSQHIILGNDYLKIHGIEINNHKERYFTIGENKRQKFAFSNIPKKISVISSVKDTYKEEFVANQLVGAQINPSLSPKMRQDLIDVLYTYKNAFASDNEPLGTIKGHEVDINPNIYRPYPQVFRRPAYQASPRSREALEKHIQELLQLGVLRKVGHSEEVEVTTPVIIAWNNDKSRMVGDFRALNTYTAPDRYPIPRIQENLTQLSKDKYTKSMDALKGFHQKFLIPKTSK